MYFTTLPDHTDPAFDEQAHFEKFQRHNIVFNALSHKSRCDRHVGCLSIKTLKGGEEWYRVDGRDLTLREGHFLLLNNDQEYACRIDTTGKVRVQSIFFRKDYAAAVLYDTTHTEETLLDNPVKPTNTPEFHQSLHDLNPTLQNDLHRIFQRNPFPLDEQLLPLLQHLLLIHKKETIHKSSIPAAKPATRHEIFRRLCIAKDLLHACFMDQPDLDTLSQTACMSVPQLIRQFKIVFHKTPHQYLIGLKLEEAARLLHQTNIPINEITWKCGFENTSAFCRAFKNHYNISPTQYRTEI